MYTKVKYIHVVQMFTIRTLQRSQRGQVFYAYLDHWRSCYNYIWIFSNFFFIQDHAAWLHLLNQEWILRFYLDVLKHLDVYVSVVRYKERKKKMHVGSPMKNLSLLQTNLIILDNWIFSWDLEIININIKYEIHVRSVIDQIW